MVPLIIQNSPDGAVVAVRVIPRARKSELAGTREGALLVRLAAPPVEGAANEALVEFLARLLGVPRRAVRLVSGDRQRNKRVQIAGIGADAVRSRLGL